MEGSRSTQTWFPPGNLPRQQPWHEICASTPSEVSAWHCQGVTCQDPSFGGWGCRRAVKWHRWEQQSLHTFHGVRHSADVRWIRWDLQGMSLSHKDKRVSLTHLISHKGLGAISEKEQVPLWSFCSVFFSCLNLALLPKCTPHSGEGKH